MSGNQENEVKNKIVALKELLQQELLQNNADDELKEILDEYLLRSLEIHLSRREQCVQMTKLGSYASLEEKTQSLSEEPNTWLYIGYTRGLGDYLWRTKPKSQVVLKDINTRNLVKSHTYYAHLPNETDKTEDKLLRKFTEYGNCFNEKNYGIKNTNGIVYVLVYTQ